MIGNNEECWSSSRDAIYGMPYDDITQLFSTLAGEIISGRRMMNEATCPNAKNSPCKRAFLDWVGPDGQGPGGRSSWDPFVVLVAARGLEGAHGTARPVNVYVEPNGDEDYVFGTEIQGNSRSTTRAAMSRMTSRGTSMICCAPPPPPPRHSFECVFAAFELLARNLGVFSVLHFACLGDRPYVSSCFFLLRIANALRLQVHLKPT